MHPQSIPMLGFHVHRRLRGEPSNTKLNTQENTTPSIININPQQQRPTSITATTRIDNGLENIYQLKPFGSILFGYIVEETFLHWLVNLCNNTIVVLPRGICSRLTGKYTFPLSSDLDRGITSVWPVRILLCESGDISLILVRYCYNSDTRSIDETKCS